MSPMPPPVPPPPDPSASASSPAAMASLLTSPPGSCELPTPQIPDGMVVMVACVLCGTRTMHRAGDTSAWRALVCGGWVYYACPAEVPRLMSKANVRERFIARVTKAIQSWRSSAPPKVHASLKDGRFN